MPFLCLFSITVNVSFKQYKAYLSFLAVCGHFAKIRDRLIALIKYCHALVHLITTKIERLLLDFLIFKVVGPTFEHEASRYLSLYQQLPSTSQESLINTDRQR